MLIETLDRQLARLRTRLAKTPLPAFFAWWGENLLACLPQRWRDLIADRNETLLLEQQPGQTVVWRARGRAAATEYGRIAQDQPPEAQVAEFRRLRERIEDPTVRTIYCIDAGRVLRRTISLPAAAEENLRQVLSFEMDRQTPFKADQVYFDSRIVSRDASGRTIHVELVLLPRPQLDAEITTLAGGALALDGVDIWRAGHGGQRSHINLLPPDRRAHRRDLRLPLNLGLAALAVVLLLLAMSKWLDNRAAAVESMREKVNQADAQARQVSDLKRSLVDSIAGANFLADKKRNEPLVVAVLDDLTQRLPDDTFLERMNIENGQLQLQGQSREAAKLIGLLGESPYLSNPNFQGAIQPDPRTSKERFQITAELKRTKVAGTEDAGKGATDGA
ncbi:PilN domain-containing protein [Dokdonella koreensis]|uniref:General secretion pathway protein L n=1 Tax=Dokdonella koreensis DS-123 TaxID=1300342 RepID=A0A160DRY5_9GAMM|nr:PilN domain-containing protein [Dokdonella koreensis]ANB16794.1 General secretion pathway protein L [Dokdonella koreensis DS-123]